MLRRVFKAFHYRDFRLLWFGACTSSIGTWMQSVAQSWLVLTISGSAFLLGLDGFLGQIPIVLFSLIGGVIADRIDRRRVLLGSQYVQMTCAFVLTVLLLLRLLDHRVWPILCLSFVVGCAQSFGGPAYSALVPSLVEKEDLPNAIALNSIQFNLARVIGPMLGGLALTGLGAAWCFGLNGLSFVAVIISLLLLQVKFAPQNTGDSILTGVKQGIGFIRRQGAMEGLIVLAFCMTALAIPMLTFLPVFAKDVFHGGPTAFTILLSCSGAGSVAGALIVAAFGNVSRKGLVALVMLMLLGCGMAAFALSRSLVLSCVILFLSGAALMATFSMISSLVQLITANEMRGRVMSVYNVAFRGGMPLGSIVTGYLVPIYSAPRVLAVNGILLVALAAYFLVAQRRVAAL
ncbi:MAG TPA: MFS transporter [Bryobacteraceae bacterium]|nr:MFS transporter [Bryobacteraceae bacterium]